MTGRKGNFLNNKFTPVTRDTLVITRKEGVERIQKKG